MNFTTRNRLAEAARWITGGWAVIILLLLSPSPASAAESSEKLKQAIASTTDPIEAARLRKQLGDQLVAQDDLQTAADEYIKALDLRREAFSSAERVRMAVYLSWADRLARSKDELNAVLAAAPDNLEARVHLARVLSWNGELSGAIHEADRVLEKSPENRDALLIKADALQWQGKLNQSIPIYRSLVEKNDDFDSRIGLSNAYLAAGNRTAAEESRRLLQTPANAQQKRRLARLVDDLEATARPKLDWRYSYYNDSDENLLNRYSIASSFWVGNFDLGMSFRHTQAWGNRCALQPPALGDCRLGNDTGTRRRIRNARAEDLNLKLYTHPTELFGLGGGIGFGQVADGGTSTFPTGHLKVDAKVWNGSAGASFSREVFSDTAELIKNKIRSSVAGFYLSQSFTDRLSFWGGYNYKSYSDHNHAHDAQSELKYFVYLNPKIAVGHRFRFLDFKSQSRSGFFDPDDYVSNRFFSSLYVERDFFYLYADAFVGHQSFERNGVASKDFIKGGSASIGLKPSRSLAVELSVEGGDFAAASAAGFNYFLIGPRIVYRF